MSKIGEALSKANTDQTTAGAENTQSAENQNAGPEGENVRDAETK